MRRTVRIGGVALMVAGAYAVGFAQGKAIDSAIVSAAQSKLAEQAAWGEFHAYYEGATSQTPAMLVGIADIKPGQQNHAPHLHADEEFLYVVEGDGTWTLGDKTSPAHAGDILYSAPGVLHGIKNTSDKPLKWLVVKWRSK
jgi:mannose-6-phosphate isomerase-like protein (cupin superfamily)